MGMRCASAFLEAGNDCDADLGSEAFHDETREMDGSVCRCRGAFKLQRTIAIHKRREGRAFA
jgi:hypothetical protein